MIYAGGGDFFDQEYILGSSKLSCDFKNVVFEVMPQWSVFLYPGKQFIPPVFAVKNKALVPCQNIINVDFEENECCNMGCSI